MERLQKVIANSGYTSRRKAEELIKEGRVKVNDVTIIEMGYLVKDSDIIKVDNSGVTVTLVKGRKSEVVFINPRTGERIVLSYNPGEQNTQMLNLLKQGLLKY